VNAADLAAGYLNGLTRTLQGTSPEAIGRIAAILERSRTDGRTIFLMGNGGSAATASHIALDLGKGTIRPGAPRLRAIALTDNVPVLTAWANDTSYERVFAAQLETWVRPGDVVIAISSRGRSPIVLEAVRRARTMGAVTIGLSGFDGGVLKDLVDLSLVVPSDVVGQIEDAHLAIGHILTSILSLDQAAHGT